MKIVLNGELLEEKDAVISVTSKAFQYAYSIYEVIKVKEGKPVFFLDHYKRLTKSASLINLKLWFNKRELESWVDNIILENRLISCRLRILVVGLEKKCFITPEPLLEVKSEYYEKGVSCSLYYGERFLPNAKTSNLLMSYLALEKAKEEGFYEALFVNKDNLITEGTRSNFYALLDGRLYTADDSLVLDGITRLHVLKAAKKLGLEISYEAPKVGDIKYFDGVFLSSTSMLALPISTIGKEEMKKDAWNIILKIKDQVDVWENTTE